jgi:hypothetical protein
VVTRSWLNLSAFRHHVEAHNNTFKLRLGRRVLAHDQWIVTGDDVVEAGGVGAQRVIGLEATRCLDDRDQIEAPLGAVTDLTRAGRAAAGTLPNTLLFLPWPDQSAHKKQTLRS